MIAALSLAIALAAQHGDPPAIDHIVCTRQVILPMLDSGRQAPAISLEIGGKTYKFALDTGAVGGRISQDIVKSLNLKPVGKVLAGDPSGKNSREVNIYKIPQIKAG